MLRELTLAYAVEGKQVHDGNVVAVALAHHVSVIVTSNSRHFARFSREIAVEDLGAEPGV